MARIIESGINRTGIGLNADDVFTLAETGVIAVTSGARPIGICGNSSTDNSTDVFLFGTFIPPALPCPCSAPQTAP
jgi:hypothetical protein